MKLLVVLPAYNEAENLPPLFDGLRILAPQIAGELIPIVVDDGSQDGTAEVADQCGRDLGVRVLRHKVNQGLGAGLRTGLRVACAMTAPGDVAVLLDADNTHDPCHILPMLDLLEQGHDIVIASRYAPGGQEIGLTPVRRLGSRVVSFCLSRAFPIEGARDYTCGFRAYRACLLCKGFDIYGEDLISETSFVCMAELLVKLHSVGARVGEVPLALRYDLKQGKSKMRIVRTVRRYLTFVSTQRRGIQHVRKEYAA